MKIKIVSKDDSSFNKTFPIGTILNHNEVDRMELDGKKYFLALVDSPLDAINKGETEGTWLTEDEFIVIT